jgi:hypothetical protein
MRIRLHSKYPFVLMSLAGFLWLTPSVNAQVTAPPPDNGHVTMPPVRDNDTTQGELSSMDRFLDSHPEIAEQVRKDPSLVDNKEFVRGHPALQDYLQDHPRVREEIRENPNAFMRQEDRYDRQGERRDPDPSNKRDPNNNREDVAGMDRFLDRHPEIAEQLRKDPSLANNREFVRTHPALKDYLEDHPEVREGLRSNPNAFMRREDSYDRREDNRDRGQDYRGATTGMGDHDRDYRGATNQIGDRDGRGDTASFGEFLHGHPNVATDLSHDPSLANNSDFVAKHPELQDYLKDHPATQQQLSQDPQAFMKSVRVTGPPTKAPDVVPNPKLPNPKENH